MPSPSEVDEFREILAGLALAAAQRVATLAAATDLAAWQEMYPVLIDPYIAASGALTAEWYRNLAPDVPFAVEPLPQPDRSIFEGNARWAVTQLDPVDALAGNAERQVFNVSRRTVAYNARREGVRYARVARLDACSWCRMLATRGAVYYSEDTAEFGHDDCYCTAVADRPGNPYVEPDRVKQWRKDYENAAADESGTKDIINHMRRHNYARNKDAINAQQREWYRARKARKQAADN